MNKVVVDTNLFIYALDKHSKYHERSVKIITSEDYDLYTTSKNIAEYLAVATKMEIEQVRILNFLDDINRNITIIFPTSHSSNIFYSLFKKYSPKGNRVHDIEIISIALSNEIKTVATFNIQDFKNIKEIKLLDL